MIIHSRWKPKGTSEFVVDREGRGYEIATFEGRRRLYREVRASVFLKGGPVQFVVDAEAGLSQADAIFDALRREARRRIAEGDWEPGVAYDLLRDSPSLTG